MKYFLIILGTIATLIGGSIWYGYVLSILWSWFVVNAFHVAQISVPVAIGVSLVVNMFVSRPDTNNKKSDDGAAEAFTKAIMYMIGYPLLVLGLGAIVHLFV